MRHPSALIDGLRGGGWLLLLGLAGCVEPYLPEVVDAPTKYLVVDGFINGAGRTRITLSRTQNIGTAAAPPAEKGATVFMTDDTGQRYMLTEQRPGFYVSDSLLLNPARRYQLRISTASAATYASDLVPLKITPEFDQLGFVHQADRYQLQLSAHDASGQSRYYRWGFTETWEFNSAYHSDIEFRGGIIQSRITPIYMCWITNRSSLIQQGSTASLNQDKVQGQLLTSFSDHAERLKIRYSVLVTQYAETAEEFAYNDILRKNTEAVGTVNDPLPSQLTGNVHRVDNPAETVLGFVGAHTLTQQRLWLTPASLGLPKDWVFENPYSSCAEVMEPVPDPEDKWPNVIYPPHTRVFAGPDYVPTRYSFYNGDTAGYYGATRFCVDCRVRGSNQKPSFW